MDFSIELFGKTLKNPIMTASGCFAFGEEASSYQDITQWGALVSTAVTLEARLGNPSPRVCETSSGMLNSVGLQNPGIEAFKKKELPFMLEKHPAPIINVSGNTIEEYVELCSKLQDIGIFAIEINLSCPNVKHGGMAMGTDPDLIFRTIESCKRVSDIPLIAKLTPNVTDIKVCAKAAEEAKADAVSLVNTFLAMQVDVQTRRPVLRNNTGGLSGPCIKPIALRMVAEVFRTVNIPVIGLGGIQSAKDVLEFMLAGARCVQIGSANFSRPYIITEILEELDLLSRKLGIFSLDAWIGSLEYWNN